ncbi:hypothetical protein HYT32_01040 [Candidatus Roizmanbacteria bacterium]|nr:hypothetical protein [Candidatus Roizmanbacteria bacterium]
MDPNNNQQQNISNQGIPQQQNPPQPPVTPAMDQQGTQYQNPHANKGSKTTLFLVILLLVVIAMASYLIFLSSTGNNAQNVPVPITNPPVVVSSPTPTPEPADNFDLEDPELDLKDLETSALEL